MEGYTARFDPSSFQLPNWHIDSSIRQLSAAGWKGCLAVLHRHRSASCAMHLSTQAGLRPGGGRAVHPARRLLPQNMSVQGGLGRPTAGSSAPHCDPMPNRYHLRSWIDDSGEAAMRELISAVNAGLLSRGHRQGRLTRPRYSLSFLPLSVVDGRSQDGDWSSSQSRRLTTRCLSRMSF